MSPAAIDFIPLPTLAAASNLRYGKPVLNSSNCLSILDWVIPFSEICSKSLGENVTISICFKDYIIVIDILK